MATRLKAHLPLIVALLRISFACATLVGLAATYLRADDNPEFRVSNFFSYFTVQNNLFGAAIMLLGAYFILRKAGPPRWYDFARGASTVYLIAVFVVFAVLVKETALQNPYLVAWADNIIHVVFPPAMTVDWLLLPPRRAIPGRVTAAWLLYPTCYLVYSFIRGWALNWYPYPFLEPDRHTNLEIALTCLGIAIFTAVVSVVVKASVEIRNMELFKTWILRRSETA